MDTCILLGNGFIHQELQCEDLGHKVEDLDLNEEEHNIEEVQSEKEEEQEYQGPVTRAKAKALKQANVLMAHYFDT